jgi:hypothetical protein
MLHTVLAEAKGVRWNSTPNTLASWLHKAYAASLYGLLTLLMVAAAGITTVTSHQLIAAADALMYSRYYSPIFLNLLAFTSGTLMSSSVRAAGPVGSLLIIRLSAWCSEACAEP